MEDEPLFKNQNRQRRHEKTNPLQVDLMTSVGQLALSGCHRQLLNLRQVFAVFRNIESVTLDLLRSTTAALLQPATQDAERA